MLKNMKRNENGDIIILFAGVIILLVVFLGLSTDVVLAFNKKSKLTEVGNLMKDARFDLGEELWQADYPEDKLREISLEISRRNGLRDDQVEVEWMPVRNDESIRQAQVKITLTDNYECTSLKIFGVNNLPIRVVIEGSQVKTGFNLWSPGMY